MPRWRNSTARFIAACARWMFGMSIVVTTGTCQERYVRGRALKRTVLAELIGYAVWPYFRFPLSLRMVQEMLAARGILVTSKTIRQ